MCKVLLLTTTDSDAVTLYTLQFISLDVQFINHKNKKQIVLITVDHYSDYFEMDIIKDLLASR